MVITGQIQGTFCSQGHKKSANKINFIFKPFLSGKIETVDKARVPKLKKDLLLLEKILKTVDNEMETVQLPKKRQVTHSEKRQEEEQSSGISTLPRQLCPDSIDRLACFESYMVLWLHMVGDTQGKRTYIGKRSGIASGFGNNPSDFGFDDVSHGKTNENIYDILYGKELKAAAALDDDGGKQYEEDGIRHLPNEDRVRQMCSFTKNKNLCSRVKIMNIVSTGLRARATPLLEKKRGLCEGVTDNISCFNRYLGVFANMHSDKEGAHQFVGRRSSNS